MNLKPLSMLFASVAIVFAGIVPAGAENVDPLNTGSQYAHGENIGWLNAEPGENGGDGAQVDDGRLTGWIWAENIGWISLSCENTGSCAAVDYGIKNDGAGVLSCYAWSENAGWISFSCANTESCGAVNYGVQITLASGKFSGQAWGENTGWINFDSQNQTAYMIVTSWTDSMTWVAGRVWIDFGGHPDLSVTNATIALEGTGYLTTADADGNFLIAGMAPGTYTVVVTAPDMIPLRHEVTVSAAQKLDVALPQMAVLPPEWDAGQDGRIGIEEAIRALQTVSNLRVD